MNIEFELTTDCNLKCFNCDRQCRQFPAEEYMTLETVELFISHCEELSFKMGLISLCGGEPLLHKDWAKIAEMVKPYASELRLVTNGTIPCKPSPLIDSWVNTRKTSPVQLFDPINVAPIDEMPSIPKESYHKACWVLPGCGAGFSVKGEYFVCGTGAAIDRAFKLGIGFKHLRDLLDEEKTNWQKEMLCSLCGRFLSTHFNYPRIDCERFSPSWTKALRKAKDE